MKKFMNASIKRKARHSCDVSSIQDVDLNSLRSLDSQDSDSVDPVLKAYFNKSSSLLTTVSENGKTTVSCKICNDVNNKTNFVILSCNHIFHIQCLADLHYSLVYKFPVIDKEYFSSCICYVCRKELEMEELMYLHSKFLCCTKDKIDVHNQSIVELEEKMKNLRAELRTCYEYKHKLEKDREEAKKIIASISSNIN